MMKMNPMAYVRNLCESVVDEFAYKKLVKQAKNYGRSLVPEQLGAGRWYSGDELDQRVEAGVADLMFRAKDHFKSLDSEDTEWMSKRLRHYVWSSCIEGSFSYKLGFEWRDKEDPWKRLIDEGKVLLEEGKHGLGRVLPTSAKRTVYEEFSS